jgi:hypothetical protein
VSTIAIVGAGNGISDGEINGGLSHEHVESITDPIPNDAWTNGFGANQGLEVGDQCNRVRGNPLGTAPNGAAASCGRSAARRASAQDSGGAASRQTTRRASTAKSSRTGAHASPSAARARWSTMSRAG